jgi:hypothetical protein
MNWPTKPDSNGRLMVISVDLQRDLIEDELLTEKDFAKKITETEFKVRKCTGEFKLREVSRCIT